MIKLVLWGVRKAGTTHADFFHGNHVVHGQIVRDAPPDFRAHIVRYTQSYVSDAAYPRGDATQIDSVSELWYPSQEVLQANLSHPYYHSAILADGEKFASMHLGAVHVAVEEIIGDPPLRGQGVKVMHHLRAAEHVAPEIFAGFWERAHNQGRNELTGLLGHTRNHVPPNAPAIVGVPPTAYAAFWLDGQEHVPGFQRYFAGVTELGASEGILEPDSSFFLVCDEFRVIDSFADPFPSPSASPADR